MDTLKERSESYDTSTNQLVHMYETKNNGTPYLISTWTGLRQLSRGGYQGFAIPDFHSRKRKGELLPQTPWRKLELAGSMAGEYDLTYLYKGYTYHQTIDATYVLTDPSNWAVSEEELDAAAVMDFGYVQEAAAKIYSSGFDALTWLAELASVRTMFLGAAKKLANLELPKNWKKLPLRKRTWKKLVNEWLEGRYGWRTLIFDIFNINECITSWNNKKTRLSERSGTRYRDIAQTAWNSETTYFTRLHTMNRVVEVGLTGTVVADIEVPKIQFNPLQTAWELIPLSFVLDWFWSVGKSIQAISFLAHQAKYSASAGLYVRIEKSYDINISATKTGYISGNCWSRGSSFGELRVRTPCNVPLTPHLTLRLNAFKVLDLVAIATQRILSRR